MQKYKFHLNKYLDKIEDYLKNIISINYVTIFNNIQSLTYLNLIYNL